MALLIAVLVAACDLIGFAGRQSGGPYPEACAQWDYSPRRCAAIVDQAMSRADIDEADVIAIHLLPFEHQQNLGGGQVALVQFDLANGSSVKQDVFCVGVSSGRACNDLARLELVVGVDRDVPCAGEPPAGCATQPPEPDAAAIAAAQPFTLSELDVSIDHTGDYLVRLGMATLPNGYLSERSFDIVDRQPDRYWIDGGVRLEIRPDIAGRPPIGNIYRDPFDGPEPVTIWLVFEVTDLDLPATMQVRDIVVR